MASIPVQEEPVADTPQRPTEVCPRCGERKAVVIGRSTSTKLVYVQCDACGHVTVRGEH
jgi:hypothetical protein